MTAKHVVLAGNAYMGKLIPKLSARVLPSASSVIATEPLSEALADKACCPVMSPCVIREQLWTTFRLSSADRMLFGGLSNYTGMEPKNLVSVMRKKDAQCIPGSRGYQSGLRLEWLDWYWYQPHAAARQAWRRIFVTFRRIQATVWRRPTSWPR